MTKKDKTEDKGELMILKDPERGGQMVPAALQKEVMKLADDMGLDLRLGHITILGGKPYVGKAGLQYLMQRPEGPGIKSLKYNWIVDEWQAQHFVVECIIETNAGDVYPGEGDAVGVPVAEVMRLDKDAVDKKLTAKERKDYIARGIKDYPLKNVTSFIAENFATRRMAMTRAFNRAASIAVKVVLPTAEEHVLVAEYTDAEYTDDEDLATKEQVKKIMEFHKSSSSGIKKLFEQHLSWGRPDTWPKQTASDFLKAVAEVKKGEMAKAKEDAEVIEGSVKELEPEKEEEKEAEKAEEKKPPIKGSRGQTGLDTK